MALSSDIRKAYLMIGVHESHRDLLRCLWWDDVYKDDPTPKIYRFTRVIFGATPSQFLLNGTLDEHAKKYEKIDAEFARKVRKDFYSDDLCTGAKNRELAYELYKKFRVRFAEANFDIVKWRTNDKDLRELIGDESEHDDEAKILGIKWDEVRDEFILGVKDIFVNAENINPTKRNVLKVIASCYDPIGYLSPITIQLKLLFQEICSVQITWDDLLPADLVKKWNIIVGYLKIYSDQRLCRRYFVENLNDPIEHVYLHGFSDSSKVAYGAVVYLKARFRSGIISTSLVSSKARVVPLKKIHTIPRLELLGNLILARLINVIWCALNEERRIDDLFCWTDSKVSLSWIKATRQEFKVFVENRVNEIRRLVEPTKWYHVKSSDNSADILTRESTFNYDEKWWKPPFLSTIDEDNLILGHGNISDSNNTPIENEKFNEEVRCLKNTSCIIINSNVNLNHVCAWVKRFINNCRVTIENRKLQSNLDDKEIAESSLIVRKIFKLKLSLDKIIDIESYSSAEKLFNVTAWVLRFINNLKEKNNRITNETLSCSELQCARNNWLAITQNSIEQDEYFRRNNIILKKDNNGLIRLQGRINEANLPFDTKQPIVLPKSYLTELLILDCHSYVKHNGYRSTLEEFRSRYWCRNIRTTVRSLVRKCRLCRIMNSRAYTYPNTPDLPQLRLRDDYAFSGVGCDYIGPLYAKNVFIADTSEEEDMYKCYVILYTCASTRGVILDVVPDLSADHCLYSLRRFFARRGVPQSIFSDNGTAFAAKMVQCFTSNRNIEWYWNVPKASWRAGFFERLVQTVKRCLTKTVKGYELDYVELQTVLYEIELIMNSRPLGPIYDEGSVLTPNHLLFGRKLRICNDESRFVPTKITNEKRVSHLEIVIDHYWTRWSKEYLTSLRNYELYVNKKKVITPSINDIVLVKDDKMPRYKWRLGRVTELIVSRDKQIRSVKLLMGNTRTSIKRPINHLYPIELN